MKRKAPVLALLTLVSAVAAADLKHGEALHQAHCIQCHTGLIGGDGSALYTRENRRVTSLPGLSKQVRWCRDNLGLTWFDEDVADVTAFLNTRYYRFEE